MVYCLYTVFAWTLWTFYNFIATQYLLTLILALFIQHFVVFLSLSTDKSGISHTSTTTSTHFSIHAHKSSCLMTMQLMD